MTGRLKQRGWLRSSAHSPSNGCISVQVHGSFLDLAHFEQSFARLLEPYRDRVGTLIFQFGRFSQDDFAQRGEFVRRLDSFLARLPGAFRYAVEVRNPEYLTADYLAMLAGRNTANVFNTGERMPDGDPGADPRGLPSRLHR
jgi:uncharacterized protein YecE (DUF72 family)